MLKSVIQPIAVILIGVIVFLLDYFERVGPGANELVLFLLTIGKSVYFVILTFGRIRKTLDTEFFYHEFLSFILYYVLLIILSFAVDFYCLFRIDNTAFLGIQQKQTILDEFVTFIYFSIATFTTVGFGDIFPRSTSAQVFVSAEVLLAFSFNILIIANIVHIRESLGKKEGKSGNKG
ncbi:MAG: hypothetical protein DYG98_09590 [Haliscomenobacteraceae bacterium CHB4]|nr:hypothetical protein [Saprospiraceae bacterium]MCE7923299.1 hypothetical protein [Haliscomenobacteraceae bacterium CHB4]